MNALATPLLGRLKSCAGLKCLLLVVLNAAAYFPYLYLQQHTYFPVRTMQPSWLDGLIPFWPGSIWIYLSLYLLMPIGPLLLDLRSDLLRYASGILFICGLSGLIFLFFPTVCPRPNYPPGEGLYHLLTKLDKPLHAFPSLHAAYAVYGTLWAVEVARKMNTHPAIPVLLGLWTVAILLATLTTKQHVLADLVGGFLLAGSAYYLAALSGKNPFLHFNPVKSN